MKGKRGTVVQLSRLVQDGWSLRGSSAQIGLLNVGVLPEKILMPLPFNMIYGNEQRP